MKKTIILVLLMVLCLGSAALAAEVKLGGQVRYYMMFPADEQDWWSYVQFRLKADATLSELTSAKIELISDKVVSETGKTTTLGDPDEMVRVWVREECGDHDVAAHSGGHWEWRFVSHSFSFDDVPLKISTAELITKVPGVGTLSAGINPDFSVNPFQFYNVVWGGTNDTMGFSFATENFGGFAAQAFYAPVAEGDTSFSGEVTYNLPFLDGALVGVAAVKDEGEDAKWAFVGSLPVVKDTLSIYGEYGKEPVEELLLSDDDDEEDWNVRAVGAKLKAGKGTFYAETDLESKSYQVQGTIPVNDVLLNAAYQWGDGYAVGTDGQFKVWARVNF